MRQSIFELGVSIELPAGWRRSALTAAQHVQFARDGLAIEFMVRRVAVKVGGDAGALRHFFENDWAVVQAWGEGPFDLTERVEPREVSGSWYDARSDQTIREWLRADSRGLLNFTAVASGRVPASHFDSCEAIVGSVHVS